MIDRLLHEALVLYPFSNPEVELIRHNENATYKVIDDGEKHVLRIHKPIQGFSLGIFGGDGHSVDFLKGELAVISSLSMHTDIPVQTPVKNKNGETVSALKDGTPVTVLQWIDGDTLDNMNCTDDMLFRIGEMAAKLRRHAQRRGDKIHRYHYDQSMLPLIAKNIENAAEGAYISPEQAENTLKAIARIYDCMDELDAVPNSKGIVHSDLSKSNMIYSNGSICPIDFCLCGYSHYYMDLGSLFGHFSDVRERKLIIDGYENVIEEKVDLRFIEPYFALQVILFIACQYERAKDWEWFGAAMDRWCKDIFAPLHAQNPFLSLI